MRRQTVLISLLGLAAGASAAWRINWRPTAVAGPPAHGQAGQVTPATGTDTTSAWRALLTGGGKGVADRLLQAELVSRAAGAEIPRLLELAGGDRTAREMLLHRWAALDPAAAAQWLGPLMRSGEWPGPEGRESDVEIVFSVWAKTDPAAALAGLRAGAPTGHGILWTGVILDRLLNEDMAAGIRLGGLTESTMDLTQTHYRPSGVNWVERDPAKAAALLSALPPGEFRDRGLNAAISHLAKTDLAAAIALQDRFPRLEVQAFDLNARNDFFEAWAGKDPASLTGFMESKAPEKDQPAIKAALARALAEKDPGGALDWAAAHLSGERRSETVGKILTSLTRSDPEAALKYLNSLAPGTALNSAVDTFTDALRDGGPEMLLAKAGTLPEGAARQAITTRAYGQMYAADPEGMLRSLASQPQENLPDGLWRRLGETTGDIDAGISRLASLPPEAGQDFIRGVFQRNIDWGDFLKFSKAMESLTDPGDRAAAMEGAMPRLLLQQYARVADWAKSLPPGERSQVAAQLEKNVYNMTEIQRRELIGPLR